MALRNRGNVNWHSYHSAHVAHGKGWNCEREEVTAGWGKLRSEEFHNLYAPTNIIRVIAWRITWEGYKLGRREITQYFSWKARKNIALCITRCI
jgi:hypothetical protein